MNGTSRGLEDSSDFKVENNALARKSEIIKTPWINSRQQNIIMAEDVNVRPNVARTDVILQ